MNIDKHSDPLIHQLTEAAHHAADTAEEIYQSADKKAIKLFDNSREYVRRNPVPVILGALALGVAIGYAVTNSCRKASFGERFSEEPLNSVRTAILSALAPVTQRVHDGYDSTRDGFENAIQHLHGCNTKSLSDRMGRIRSNLKFW